MFRTVAIVIVCVTSSVEAHDVADKLVDTSGNAAAHHLLDPAVATGPVAHASRQDRYKKLEQNLGLLDPAAQRRTLTLAEQLVRLISGERSADVWVRGRLVLGGADEFADELQAFAPDVARRLQQALDKAEPKTAKPSIFHPSALWLVVTIMSAVLTAFLLSRLFRNQRFQWS